MTDTRRIVYQTHLFQGEFVAVDAIDYPYLTESGTATYPRRFVFIESGSNRVSIPPEALSPLIAALVEMSPEWRELLAAVRERHEFWSPSDGRFERALDAIDQARTGGTDAQ